MTLLSASLVFAGKTFGSTIVAASVHRTCGQVLSCWFSVMTTLSPSAFTLCSGLRSPDGPLTSLMRCIRWNEKTTAFASSGSPLENFRFGFMVQVYVAVALKSHDDAASGTGVVWPAG